MVFLYLLYNIANFILLHPITLSMSYNKGNQLTQMTNGKDSISYSYDKNGSMVQKVLSSKEHGKLTDSYTYNSQDMITSYVGYDYFEQKFTYDANGICLTKHEKGNANRSTLEELLRSEIAGLPSIVNPSAEDISMVEAGYEWATTEYLYDITQENYQVIMETTIKDKTSDTTAYSYGLERISGYFETMKSNYVYDGRGSVAQTVLRHEASEQLLVESYAYTAFGEQLKRVKHCGYGYNAEYYDAATGMQNLRARLYEPAVGRFSGKDIVRGEVLSPLSQNLYVYVFNNPMNWDDPSGMTARTEKEILGDINALRALLKRTDINSNTKIDLNQQLTQREKQMETIIEMKELVSSAKKAADNKELKDLDSAVTKLESLRGFMNKAMKNEHDKLVSKLSNLTGNSKLSKKEIKKVWEEIQAICDNMNIISGANKADTEKNKAKDGKEMLLRIENDESYPQAIRDMATKYLNMLVGGETKSRALKLRDIKAHANTAIGMLFHIDLFLQEQSRYYNPSYSGNDLKGMPKFTNEVLQDIANGTSANISGKQLQESFLGKDLNMTNDNWLEFSKLLAFLESTGRLAYGEKDTASRKYEGGILTLDCWGALDFAFKVITNGEDENKPVFKKISNMFEENYKEMYTFPDYVGATNYKNVPSSSTLNPGEIDYILVETASRLSGYDQIFKVVKNLPDKNNPNIIYSYGLIGVGGSDNLLQTYDLYEYIAKNNTEIEQMWTEKNGDKIKHKMPKIVYIPTK